MIQGNDYLNSILDEMAIHWPNNRTINIVCHGHSVPAGYFATPFVNTFGSYPHLLHKIVKERFPFAVTNVIVTAIGGEHSVAGELRFRDEVLCHCPDILTIDYGLNDRAVGLEKALDAWKSMIEQSLDKGIKVILCTPTWDNTYYLQNDSWKSLIEHAKQIRTLAERYSVGLADSFHSFEQHIVSREDLAKYLSHVNHPSQAGHQLVADEIAKYFVAR